MALLKFNGVGISGLSAAVPQKIYYNRTDNKYFASEDAEKIVDKIGVEERRIAENNTCSSDLGLAAADRLLAEMNIEKNSVDALIFVSQTADYRIPATGIILQHKLGLPKSCAAFDVNLGCSGFVYGLSMAYSFATQPTVNRVLLITAETRTKVYSFKDRKTCLLFGDAATACLIEKNEKYGDSLFKLDSDGSKSDYIIIKSGGYRNPSTPESFIERDKSDGGFHSDEQVHMDGAGVFEFVITNVPRHIRSVLKECQVEKEDVAYFVFHQANRFMNEHVRKMLKLEKEKVPYSFERFGNTSSVSIPLTIATELREKLETSQKVVISGFGVGLSLASGVLTVNEPYITDLIEI
jgi:3-oxoacyl-[acyl-carrier-protein] synthase-3